VSISADEFGLWMAGKPSPYHGNFDTATRSTWPRSVVDFMLLVSENRYAAFSKQLNFRGFQGDVPRFYLSSWK
jgi:hypothetical protein